jgi:phosphatidylglycerol:prolipoprotein diacylglycerol transferase
MDAWLFLDAIAPAALIGQAVARPANFINQELYGQPTNLIWGIQIEASKRIAPYNNLNLYPISTTKFHPTFAYEMILNFIIAMFLLWLTRSYIEKLKPGAIFFSWLVLAGFSRAFIELFRTDQPHISGTNISFTMLIALLMSLSGLLLMLFRYGRLNVALFMGWEDQYFIANKKPMAVTMDGKPEQQKK